MTTLSSDRHLLTSSMQLQLRTLYTDFETRQESCRHLLSHENRGDKLDNPKSHHNTQDQKNIIQGPKTVIENTGRTIEI
jgi:hypothetical protein